MTDQRQRNRILVALTNRVRTQQSRTLEATNALLDTIRTLDNPNAIIINIERTSITGNNIVAVASLKDKESLPSATFVVK